MLQRAHLALLVLAGCGRLQFDDGPSFDARGSAADDASDATPCVEDGHDEDGDGFDDACDVCPQVADAQIDVDNDGIGDACDLAVTAQIRLLFDPFTQMTTNWAYQGGDFNSPDVYRINSTTGAGAVLVATPGRDTYEVRGNMIDGGAAPTQVAITISSGPDHYYCELYEEGATFSLSFTHTPDDVMYFTLDTATIPGRFDTGPFLLIMDHTPPTATCIAEWGGTRYTATAAIPAGVGATEVGIGAFSLDVAFYSFVRLTTPP